MTALAHLSLLPRCPLFFLEPHRTIFIACALGGPYPEPNFSWAGERSPSLVPVLSLCIFSTLYTGSSRVASIFYTQPNSNKAVTKVPNPVALFCPCTRVGGRVPTQVYKPEPAVLLQSQKIDQQEVNYISITKILLGKQNQGSKWDRKKKGDLPVSTSQPHPQPMAFKGREDLKGSSLGLTIKRACLLSSEPWALLHSPLLGLKSTFGEALLLLRWVV